MIAGDTHGNELAIRLLAAQAGERKITHMFIMGDFGLWTHKADGQAFLDTAQQVAEGNNLSIFAIGGNHENWDHWNWMVNNLPTHKGFAMVRRRVLIAPKVHTFRLAKKQFVVAGGAVSIDKDWRLAQERGGEFADQTFGWIRHAGKGSGPKTLWWPDEQLTEQDVVNIEQMKFSHVDYLFTHDCSDYTPFHSRLKPDLDSQLHRKKIDRVIAATRPVQHYHGHMHTKYDWKNYQSHGYFPSAFEDIPEDAFYTQTYGLECDGDLNNWGILDTDTNEFAFRGIGMNFRSLGDSDGHN
jgi:hypothetical protein